MILHMLAVLGACLIIYLGFITQNTKYTIQFFNSGTKTINKSKEGTISRSQSFTEQDYKNLEITEKSKLEER